MDAFHRDSRPPWSTSPSISPNRALCRAAELLRRSLALENTLRGHFPKHNEPPTLHDSSQVLVSFASLVLNSAVRWRFLVEGWYVDAVLVATR